MADTTTLLEVKLPGKKIHDYLKVIGDKRSQFEKTPGFDKAFWETHEALITALLDDEATLKEYKQLLYTNLGGKVAEPEKTA